MASAVAALVGRLHQKVFGHPFVYDHIRPLAVGGIDMSPVYAALEAGPDDIVLDVGCGTGDALAYLPPVKAYHGFDTDAVAIGRARERAASRQPSLNAKFEARLLDADDLKRLAPTKVVLAGLLHHLTDEQARDLFRMLGVVPTLKLIVTQDVVILPGRPLNNLLARGDRGRHVRYEADYPPLAAGTGLRVTRSWVIRCHPYTGIARYLVMTLAPEA